MKGGVWQGLASICFRMSQRTLPAGFIAPSLPTKTDRLPSGGQWLHEIKHDGFRVIARKDGPRVRLYSRPGNDLSRRFPLIVETLARLRSRSCIVDGEGVACDDNGVAEPRPPENSAQASPLFAAVGRRAEERHRAVGGHHRVSTVGINSQGAKRRMLVGRVLPQLHPLIRAQGAEHDRNSYGCDRE